MKIGELVLLPNVLGTMNNWDEVMPPAVETEVRSLQGLIAENPTEGRRFLGHFLKEKAALVPISVFSKKTDDADIDFYLEPIMKGEKWGLVSDAGLPCIADPGAKLVLRAKKQGIKVRTITGPSSIILALQLSGLNGQSFFFHGYLPKEAPALIKKIRVLEKTVNESGSTQIAIEAPHRNSVLLDQLLQTLSDNMILSLMWDLTLKGEGGITEKVSTWKKMVRPDLDKRPVVFLIGKEP